MLETSELSLEDYCFASKARNSAGPGKYRHVVDAMRTSAWFHTLRMKSGAQSTYEMEKMLEPESFGIDASGTPYKRNKWRGYRLGKHTPRPALVRAMEQHHPGTLSVFDHVLWDALRPDYTLTHHHLLNRLGPAASRLLSSSESRTQNGNLRSAFIARVERIAELDGFACLVALLRDSINSGHNTDEDHLSLGLCRSAIAAGPVLYSLGIAGPFADYLNTNFLCRATDRPRYELNAHDYLQRAKLSARIVYGAEGEENCYFSYQKKVDFILDILHGRYGDGLEQRIAPIRSTAP